MPILTGKDLHWFWLANCNGNQAFYAFKKRFLKRFSFQDGWDMQTIEKECWSCDGTGIYGEDQICRKCGGYGIYRTSEIWLQRWPLGDKVYHIPEFCSPTHEERKQTNSPRNHIEGKIKHGMTVPHPLTPLWPDQFVEIPESVSRRCFYRLLLRHEPMNFYWLVMQFVKDKLSRHRMKMYFCLIKLRNKMDLFPATPQNDVPF
jgi:hypothetical protein